MESSLSTVRPPPSTRRSRPGTGRKLPTPPVSQSPRSPPSVTLRTASFDFSNKDNAESTEDEDGRQRATLTFDSDGGGFFEVSYDAPSVTKDSPRSSISRETSVSRENEEVHQQRAVLQRAASQPAASVHRASASSSASMDTQVLLKDTEQVVKVMSSRVEKQQQQHTSYRSTHSPVNKSDLFLPIPDGEGDTDDDVSAKVLLNGDDDEEEDIPPPPPRHLQHQRSTPTDNRIWASKSTVSTSKEKVLAHFHSRSSKRNSSHDFDSVGVSDDSESASVISTSTDYSATAASPKVTRKAAKGKGNITMTRTNRAFALRRQNADSDTEPLTPRSSGSAKRSTSLTRPNSAGGSASPRASSQRLAPHRTRPSSAKETSRSSTARSDISLGQKIVNKSRENHTSSSANNAGFVRKDGGRHSLRTQKSSPAPSTPSARDLNKSKSVSASRGRANTASSGLSITGHTPPATRSNSSQHVTAKTQDYEAWKRRKTYDPRKSLAAQQAKNKKEDEHKQQAQRRARSAGQVATDHWGRSSLSSEESTSYSRTAEISQLTHSMTRGLAKMTQQARDDDDDAFKVNPHLFLL